MTGRPAAGQEAVGAPTTIWISRGTRTILLGAGVAAVVLLLWLAPSLIVLTLGGAALAIVLSFPVRGLSRTMPRSAAIALSLVAAAALPGLAATFIVPVLVAQLATLVSAIPGIAQRLGERLPSVLRWLDARGLLGASPERFVDQAQERLLAGLQGLTGRALGELGQFVTGAVDAAITFLGIVLVAVYLLTDARAIEAATIRATPHRYRRDVRALWDALGHTLSRYLGGLALSLAIQGTLSALALSAIGVPYAFLLGAWVSVTGLVPYVGALIGAVPAVLLALSVSPMHALLTAGLFLLIQQLEGNVLTPRIQGQAVHVHPALLFLAVIAGGDLFGIAGAVFAVPVVAMLRVLLDFLRVRVRTGDGPRVSSWVPE